MTAARTESYIGNNIGPVLFDKNKVQAKEIRSVIVSTAGSAAGASTMEVTLKDYGLKNVVAVRGVRHVTANQALLVEEPTTSVTSGVLTITLGGAGTDAIRSYRIVGEVL